MPLTFKNFSIVFNNKGLTFLSIYKDADSELLAAFIQTIKKQNEDNSWINLRELSLQRAVLYEKIFDFSSKEIEFCQRIGKKFEEKLIKRDNRWKLVILGSGVAAVGIAGAGAYFWRKAKKKKEEK